MEAEPTQSRDVPARAPLAAVPGRLRGTARRVRGVLRRPLARRALVVGGLAVAGWLLGAGNAASAAEAPSPKLASPAHGVTHPNSTPEIGNPVRDQVDQTGGLLHTGSDAVNRTADSLNRSRLAKHDGPTTSDPVRQKVGETGGLVHTGSDAVNRTADSLNRSSLAKRAHGGHLTTLLDGAAPEPQRADVRRIAAPVASLLDDGADKVGQALPVRDALHDPSSVVASMNHDVRPGGHALPIAESTIDQAYGESGTPSYGKRTAADRTGGRHLRAAAVPTAERQFMFGSAMAPRLLCAHSAAACDHGTRSHPHAPPAPAPTGPESDTHGLVPSPVSGQILPGTGDVAWANVDRTPHHLAIAAPGRGVLPPVVRTAADEPALSPD